MAEPTLTTISKRVAHLAALSGLTVHDLSIASGLSRNALAAVVNDDRISVESAKMLAALTGASVGWVIAEEGTPPDPVNVALATAPARAANEAKRDAKRAAKGAA